MSKPNSKTDTAWMKFYRELGEYKTKHGHTAVSVPKVARLDRAMYNNVSEYASLAKWVSRQRIAHKSGKLHPDRFQLLEDLDFYWCPTDRTWDERYEELRRNQKVVGASVYIPSNKGQVDDNETKNKPGYSERVMQWAAQQRVQYMLHLNGNHSKMNERRIAKLERIGFQWWKDDADKATIKGKADKENNVLKHAPHTASVITADEWKLPYSRQKAAFPLPYVKEAKFWPSVSRVDNAYGDRNLVCSCLPIEEYQQADA